MKPQHVTQVLLDLAPESKLAEELFTRLRTDPNTEPIDAPASCASDRMPDVVVSSNPDCVSAWQSLGLPVLPVTTTTRADEVLQAITALQPQQVPLSLLDLLPDLNELNSVAQCERVLKDLLQKLALDFRYRRAGVLLIFQLPNEESAHCLSLVACLANLKAPFIHFQQQSVSLALEEVQALWHTARSGDVPDESTEAMVALLPETCSACWQGSMQVIAPQTNGAVRGVLLLGRRKEEAFPGMKRAIETVLTAIAGRWESLVLQQLFLRHSTILEHAMGQAELGQWTLNIETGEFVLLGGLCIALGGSGELRTCQLDEWTQRIHPGDLEEWQKLLREVRLAARPLCKCQLRVLGYDGEWHSVDMEAKRAADDQGQPAPVVNGVLHDMTRFHDAVTMGNILITAVDQTGEAIMITNVDNRIEYVNPAFSVMTGYRLDQCIGKPAGLLKSGLHDDAFYQDMWASLMSGQVWSGIMTNRRRDGSLYEEESTISPIRDDHSQVIGYVAVKRDVTAILEQERQLKQAQRMESVGRLAGGLVHDFNNLLMGIMLFADFALQEVDKESPLRRQIVEISKAVRNASDLIRKLMTLSRNQQLDMQPVEVNTLITNLQNMIRGLIGENIELTMTLDSTLRPITGVGDQLEQLLLNLVVNAHDAMEGRGALQITTRRCCIDHETARRQALTMVGWYAVIEVQDNGCGIAPEILDMVFEPFFTTKPKERGTGLGLATVYSIIQQHGGSVKVESNLGEGTTFRIFLPEADIPVETTCETEAPVETRGSGTILVVEDEPMARDMLTEILDRLGYHITAACDGNEAIRIAEHMSEPVDLLLTDVIMPGPNGPAVYKRLKEMWPDLEVLFISGYARDQFGRQELQGLEGAKLLHKPFSMQELGSVIRGIFNQ